ncbi:MAG: hypothetical protein IPM07_30345 [Anaerolineales bacterium]|nr:hypothetical protein [Anaerolineales bacterium]
MGLGDMMYRLGIRYCSEEGQELAAQIMECVRYHAMQRSVELAADRGAFLAFAGSIYDESHQRHGLAAAPPGPFAIGSAPAGLNAIVGRIEEHGILARSRRPW